MALACEDANSKFVDVVDAEERVDDSMKLKFWQDVEAEVLSRFSK